MFKTSTISTNQLNLEVDLIQVITDITLRCRKIAIRIPRPNCFVFNATKKTSHSNTITSNFTLALKLMGENTSNAGDTRERSLTLHRKLTKSIRRQKNILIILTSQVLYPKLRKHLRLIIIVWMTSKVFSRRSLSTKRFKFLISSQSY
jgi:hypothetical protein